MFLPITIRQVLRNPVDQNSGAACFSNSPQKHIFLLKYAIFDKRRESYSRGSVKHCSVKKKKNSVLSRLLTYVWFNLTHTLYGHKFHFIFFLMLTLLTLSPWLLTYKTHPLSNVFPTKEKYLTF